MIEKKPTGTAGKGETMDTTRQTIGQNIRKYRQQRGVKQKDLAAALGVNSSAVSNWETGVNSIDIEALVRISSLLDVSLDALYGVQKEDAFFEKYAMLNREGRRRAEQYVDDLLLSEKYRNAGEE